VVLPVGPFKIASDNRTVTDANGQTFISYGTTVPGLSSPTFSADPNFVTNVVTGKDIPKIDATWNSGFCSYPDGTNTIPLLGAGSLIRTWFQGRD